MEAFSASEGVVLVTAADRLRATVVVQGRVVSLSFATWLDRDILLVLTRQECFIVDLADLRQPAIIRRLSVPRRSIFTRGRAESDGCHLQTLDGSYSFLDSTGEFRRLTGPDEWQVERLFAEDYSSEVLDEDAIVIYTDYN